MIKRFWLSICIVLSIVYAGAQEAIDLRSLPPEEFLRTIRDPMRADAWSVITGYIVHAENGKELLKGETRLSIRLSPKKMITQITLNEQNTYILEQTFDKGGGNAKMELEMPEHETSPKLSDYGLHPDDLTFAFFYWDYQAELTRQKDADNGLRVFRLKNPLKEGYSVKVYFNSKHGFPVEAYWMNPLDIVERSLELKGAKRHKNGLWFVREMRLVGLNGQWKTQVRFDYVEKSDIGE